jgi:hypothetical protein
MATPDLAIQNLERIRFTTQHFHDLQGLRVRVPLGLITLSLAVPALPRVVLCLMALVLLLGARRFYRSFGHVEHRPPDPAAELCPVPIFSPAGQLSRLEGAQQVTPFARSLLITAAVALALFSFFQAIPPNFVVEGSAALGQHPRVLLEPAPYLGPPLIKVLDGAVARSPSMLRAVSAQLMYVLYGAFFLSVWLWRGRRDSQSLHLVLAVLLLGLSALGTSLGYLARPGGDIPPALDRILPALVYPGLALLLCGSAMVLTGLFDHWQLVRALGRPVAEEEEES